MAGRVTRPTPRLELSILSRGRRHDAAVRALGHSGRDAPESDRSVADVSVFVYERPRQRLALRPPRQPRGRGAGLVLTEAAAVVPEGRISPQDLGIWTDAHAEPLARVARFIAEQGGIAGIQLAHAGRKASTYRPWEGNGAAPPPQGGWSNVLAPSAVPFAPNYPAPTALTEEGIQAVVDAFAQAARRACAAGFRVVEIHAAHGYLLHEFLSPLSNHRQDRYGGSFDNRTRLLREVVAAVRRVWPEQNALFVRISATDWVAGGWGLEDSVELARAVRTPGGGPDQLFVGRQRAARQDPGWPRLSDGVCRAHPAGSRRAHRRGGPRDQPGPGRPHHSQRAGRPGAAGA